MQDLIRRFLKFLPGMKTLTVLRKFGCRRALCSTLTGMLLLFMPALLHKRISIWSIGDRADGLLSRFSDLDSVCCELENSENPTLSIDGDDHVLILFDKSNRRLLIEGLALEG